ncbi:MAG: SGNH/GDSL hydrolase family protein [Bacteroidales bacterium]
MKYIVLFVLLLDTITAFSQLKYYDAVNLPLYGKATENTLTRYERLPADFKNVSRKALWYQGQCSSGMYIRFRSNAKTIGAKWELLRNKEMNHMPPVGIKGLDLYAYTNGKWHFARPARPSGKKNEAVIIENMSGEEREYMLFLPLYDQLTSLHIGVDSLAEIKEPLLNLPDSRLKPIVWYGTSITMGGCANRPGMCYTNIFVRRLNREVINLGFSGNAFYDYEIADLMGECEAALYVMDNLPNVGAASVREKGENFYRRLRKKAPETPILFIEHPIYPYLIFDQKDNKHVTDLNIAIKELYQKLKKSGERNIYYLEGKGLIDQDCESTVDGEHFTDLGYMRMADAVEPIIRKILKK